MANTIPEPQGGASSEAMDEATVRERLRGLSFMLDCRRSAEEVVGAFVELGEVLDAPDESLLLREGDVRGTFGLVLLEGRVSVIKTEREPVVVDAPALMGEMQQFSISGSRSASVLTEGPCVVLRFDWPAFYAALQERLRPLDFQQVKDAIRRYSWNHALDSDED